MSIELELTVVPCIGAAMQQNGVPLVREAALRHDDTALAQGLRLRLSAVPEVFTPFEMAVDADAGVRWRSGPLPLALHWRELAELTEGVEGLLLAELSDAGGRILLTQERPLRFMAFDQWPGLGVMPELLAAFVTPNHPRIAGVLRRAAVLLSGWGEPPVLNAYQSRSPDRVRKQAAALYGALSELGLTYAALTASFEAVGQRVRLCDRLFDEGLGNCLDMSLLFAACAEAAGLHPLVVVVRGHAFAGLWLVEETFPDAVHDDPTLLTKRIADGIHDILVVEATGMNRGTGLDFEAAVARAGAHLLDPDAFQLLVDVRRARHARIRPLPLRVRTDAGWVVGEPDAGGGEAAAPQEIAVGPRPDEAVAPTPTRQQTWERRLLDLTLRNTLLSLRPSRSQVQLLTADAAGIEDRLAAGEELQLLPAPAGWVGTGRPEGLLRPLHATDAVHGLVADDERQRRLRTCLGEVELQASLTGLYRAARLSLEENGANTLHLAVGHLRWYESDASERPRLAPVLLIPVELVRRAAHRGYVLRTREEETVANVTLLEMLRQDFGVVVAGLERLPRDEGGVDVRTALNLFRHAVRGMPRWDVEDTALLGHFSFSRFVMWHDIRSHAARLAAHPIVGSLLAGRLLEAVPADAPTAADATDPPLADVLMPILADGSQAAAIRAANEGRSFVLHGPPGTGKSQTITNIIANALYRGRRVLFVAEKMAALEVVEKRLREIGLGGFCLELHSNKTRKSDVLRRLKSMAEAPVMRSVSDFGREAGRLDELRDTLRAYALALHRPQPCGLSVYDCIDRYVPHARAGADIPFDAAFLCTLRPEALARLEDLADDLRAALRLTGDPSAHPLRQVGLDSYDPARRDEAAAGLRDWQGWLAALADAELRVGQALGLPPAPLERPALDALAAVCQVLLGEADLPGPLLLVDGLPLRLADAEGTARAGAEMRQLEAALDARYREGWRDLDAGTLLADWQRAGGRWFLPRFLVRRRVRGTLTDLSRADGVAAEAVVDSLQRMDAWRARRRSVEAAGEAMARLMPGLWSGTATDWPGVMALSAAARTLHGALPSLAPDAASLAELRRSVAARLDGGSVAWAAREGGQARAFLQAHAAATGIEASLEEMLALREAGRPVGGPGWTGRSRARAGLLLDGIGRLRDWCAWRSARQRALEAGLSPWVDRVEAGEVPAEEAVAALWKNLYRALANLGVAEEPALRAFNGVLFDEKVRRFTALCTAFERLTRQEVLDRLHARRPDLSAQARKGTEVGVLQRAIAGNGRGYTIRSLFDEAPQLLADLCPCMLMSPISVAQYLAMDKASFDLVIFDEASQMPTSGAVGAIARGASLIVVGDPRQMPPTSFFGAQAFDEENAAREDLESILDDCLALTLPSRHLRWHYRSRHESLIAFSNARFYDNGLLTFPSAADIGSRVRWVPVDGTYARGGARHNAAEARALVAEVIHRAKDPGLRGQSIGIVTFNATQQRLLQDMLDDAMALDASLEAVLLQSPEPVFIKNLENVQGDERDVILFSVGYGRDASGRVSLNFGPLNREGGWRRLNVAVSRARDEMVVFSSLRPEDIDVTRTAAEGVAGLRAFLEYASRGAAALSVTAAADPAPAAGRLEAAIADALRARGCEAHTQVGCSGFRIDIALVHPDDPTRYLLAVLCDGGRFRATPSVRDRHAGKRGVLERLGWQVHEVWSAEWWEDPAGVVDGILRAFGEARDASPGAAAPAPEVPEMERRPPAATPAPGGALKRLPGQEGYVLTVFADVAGLEPEGLSLPANRPLLRAQVRQVMQTESPVTRRLLKRRVAAAWGVSRIGSRIDRQLDEVIAELGYLRTTQASGDVLWMPGVSPEGMQTFRTPEEESARRDPEDLPAPETAAATEAVVRYSYSITEDDLLRELAEVFGYARRSAGLDEALREGIRMAAMFGRVRESGGRYRI